MSAKKIQSPDYETLKSAVGSGAKRSNQNSLKPAHNHKNLANPNNQTAQAISSAAISAKKEIAAEIFVPLTDDTHSETAANNGDQTGYNKTEKKAAKDRELLSRDPWLKQNGHNVTYVGLYLFSILVFFRPYEMFAPLAFLSATAFYFAIATLAVYIPAQLVSEGSLTVFSTEVKCVLALALIALLTMPIAKDPAMAWETFNDSFVKAVLMFIVMVNVVRTRRRLLGLLWLSLSIGVYLSYTALDLYIKGEMKVEGYRVGVEVEGLFGNPNDLALHLVTITPIAIALALGSRSLIMRVVYFVAAGFFIAANMITFSRGGFIGMLLSLAILAWKLGRENRLKVSLFSIISGGLFILFTPGNYGLRVLSIFLPGLDPNGSADERRELLIRSLLVTARNPWGIGIGNFPIVGIRNLVTHNSFTQISSELGLLGLAVYLIFIISPFRKLSAIERTLFAKGEKDWFYYLAIGLQASIIGYMASSFFVSVAYNWFVYYLIAYAVALRRIYKSEKEIEKIRADRFDGQTI